MSYGIALMFFFFFVVFMQLKKYNNMDHKFNISIGLLCGEGKLSLNRAAQTYMFC